MLALQIATLALVVLSIAAVSAFSVLILQKLEPIASGPTIRARRRRAIAEAAVDYGEQVDSTRVPPITGPEKRAHALDFCRKVDFGDNGARDFDDGEFAREIESVLGERARLSA